MTPEQIEATRPAFERFYSDDGNWPKSVEREDLVSCDDDRQPTLVA